MNIGGSSLNQSAAPPPREAASGNAAAMRSIRQLRVLFDSGRPVLCVISADEQRVGRILCHASRHFFSAAVPLWTWSLTEGLQSEHDGEKRRLSADPLAALDFIADFAGPAVFHLKDFHEPMQESATVRRRLRDLSVLGVDHGKFAVVSSPVRFLPEELAYVAHLELAAPDFDEMKAFLKERAAAIAASGGRVDMSEETLAQMARVLDGLTLDEAGYALSRVRNAGKALGAGWLPALLEEKRLTVSRTGTIEYVADGGTLDAIGGLDLMKRWLEERRPLFEQRGGDPGMVPKGVLVMGVSGCGKSLSVKAIASCFGLPLYRIDVVEVFSGRHGPPEWAFAHACRSIEAIAPAVVWFDEIELGITAAATAGEQGRIFAFFLTWMQEKTPGLFVAATANRIDLLPAEMIRKGRFDEVFFVDLPRDDERLEIFRIHLAQRGVDAGKLALERLTEVTEGWTGAEVEQCVISAMTRAGVEGRELAFDDLVRSAARIVPLSKTMKEKVEQLRNWARDRAVPASLRK